MKIAEIFNSIDGECNPWGQGSFSTFIRTYGCNLSCDYCDSKYALRLESAVDLTVKEIIKKVKDIGCKKITITGGEPLLQKEIVVLINALLDNHYRVSIETNGTIEPPIRTVNWPISYIVDYKLNYEDRMNEKAFIYLNNKDFVKILIENETDILKAESIKNEFLKKGCKARFFIGPVFGKITPQEIIKFIQENKLFDLSLNVQIHKLVGIK
jgi:7-carboxy-7-deazaguanine synthase